MSVPTEGPVPARPSRGALSPSVVLLATVGIAALLLCLPLTLPIGPLYWDLVVYFDGAQRVLDGQIPAVDFFAPVGALGYWLFAAGRSLFPESQPLLLAQWMTLVLTLPPFLPVLRVVDRVSRGRAFALLLPFLIFQMLPMNVEQYSSYPTVDGYGIYNRHVTELLYVLTAALVFERRQRVLVFAIAWCMASLFFLKITGFVSGGILCAFALAAGRVELRSALLALGAFLLVLAGLEVSMGLVGAYIGNILQLVAMNEGVLASRFLQAGSIHFGILGSGTGLLLALVLLGWRPAAADARQILRAPSFATVARFLDRGMAWLAVALFAGLFFETQNTGGQAFIFLWPILLAILTAALTLDRLPAALLATLVAATALPPAVNVVHRFARAVVGQIAYIPLPQTHLGTLGRVTQRREIIERAILMKGNYRQFAGTYEALAEENLLPSFTLYSEPDFQAGWLLAVDEAVAAILAYETANGTRFATIMSLNFVNPFPTLLDRHATRHIAIGADPFRAVPTPDANVLEAVRATDLVLYPTCPVTAANRRLFEIYEPGLEGHRRIRLSPCWEAFVRDGLAPT